MEIYTISLTDRYVEEALRAPKVKADPSAENAARGLECARLASPLQERRTRAGAQNRALYREHQWRSVAKTIHQPCHLEKDFLKIIVRIPEVARIESRTLTRQLPGIFCRETAH